MSERFATVDGLTRSVEQLAAGDPEATRVIYAIVIALVVVGLVLVLLAIWMIRRTRADPELLGPLERMSEPKWRKSGPDARRALLDEVRPAGAATPPWPQPDVAVGTELPPPVVETDAAPAVEEPADEEPAGEEPAVEEPLVEEPVAVPIGEPPIGEPLVEDPAVEEPAVEDPLVDEPAVEDPLVDEPVAVPIEAPGAASNGDVGTQAVASEAPAAEQ